MQRFTYTGYDELEKGQTISYGDLRPDKHGELIEVPYSSGSDYSGSTLDQSNFRTLWKQFNRCKGIWQYNGGYGTFGIVYNPDVMSKKKLADLEDAINTLEDYPALDDDDLNDLEYDRISEAWDDYLYDDIVKDFPPLGVFDTEELRFFLERNDAIEYVFETGGSVYVDIDRTVNNVLKYNRTIDSTGVNPDNVIEALTALREEKDKVTLFNLMATIYPMLCLMDDNAIETIGELSELFEDVEELEDEVSRLLPEDWAKLDNANHYLAETLKNWQ